MPSPWKSLSDIFLPPVIAVGSEGGDAEGGSYVGHALCVWQGVMVVVRGQERMAHM